MKKNIGTTDRILRFFFALILLAVAWWQASWIILAFSLFTFYEALAKWCVVYQFLGKNTCASHPIEKKPPSSRN